MQHQPRYPSHATLDWLLGFRLLPLRITDKVNRAWSHCRCRQRADEPAPGAEHENLQSPNEVGGVQLRLQVAGKVV